MNRMQRMIAGCHKYADDFDKWKSDLSKIVSEEFFEKLNSDEESISKDARQEIEVWGTSSSLTDLFCQGRGRETKIMLEKH